MITDSNTIGFTAFPKYDVYSLAFSNTLSNTFLSFLDGNNFLKVD